MIIAETEFLLGTAEGDRNFESVTEILKLHEKLKKERTDSGLRIAASAYMEIAFGLRGRLGPAKTADLIRALKTAVLNVEEIPATSGDIRRGLETEEALGTRNLFDCIHAGTALERGAELLSNDPFFDQIEGVRKLTFRGFVKRLKEQ